MSYKLQVELNDLDHVGISANDIHTTMLVVIIESANNARLEHENTMWNSCRASLRPARDDIGIDGLPL